MAAIPTPFPLPAPVPADRASQRSEFDFSEHIDGLPAVYGALANVCMQLAFAPVGRGVVESKVESGSILKHPVKRGRTTLSYLAVALLGDDETRRIFRNAVNGQHRQVVSDANSPTQYNAFDPGLQKWVAACLYRGSEDIQVAIHGPMDPATREAFYQEGARLGTTLQMKRETWPKDRDAFEDYWQSMVTTITATPMDPEVKQFLRRVLWAGRQGKNRAALAFGAHLRRMNIGFLPPEFREHLGVAFTDEDQRLFDAQMRRVRAVYQRLPTPLRAFPFNALLWDVKRRIRHGIPLV